jgi:acyl-CoA synthetase (AMP-forming)/AMP-acid ligase II
VTDLANLPRSQSALHVLRRHAAERPDREAVTFIRDHDAPDGADTLTYGEIDSEARRVGAWLQEQCRPGDRVLLIYPPGLDFVTAFLGCMYAGAVAVPAPVPGRFKHHQRRLTGMVADAGARLALTDTTQLAEVRSWSDGEAPELETAATDVPGLGDPAAWREPRATGRTLVLLQYTSGSTGDPKGVMVDHGNLLHNADSFRRTLGLDGRTRFGGWIPLYHDMGLMTQLLPALLFGSACVLMSPTAFLKRPHLWLDLIDQHDLHFSAAPNFAYELCVRKIDESSAANLDLSRWRFALNGSEPIQASTLRDFAKRFAANGFRAEAFAPSYGMAEATVYVSGSTGRPLVVEKVDPEALEKHEMRPPEPGGPTREIVSCGCATEFDVRIVDPNTGRVLPDGVTGEIWLRGPSVAGGYWGRAEATEKTFRARTADGDGPYLRSGDLGAILRGELYVTGRIKDLLIVHGRNLYPHDIEHELRLAHPELAALAGAVVSIPAQREQADQAEQVIVMHEIRGRLAEDRLRDIAGGMRNTVSREFGVQAAGVLLLRPGAVRRTTSGKIQRTEMRNLLLAGDLAPLYQELEPDLRVVLDGRQS